MKGKVVRYTFNKHYDIDGIVIDEGKRLSTVKFPPHTARFVLDVAELGDCVELGVQGEENAITGLVFEGKFFHLHPEEYEDDLTGAGRIELRAKKRTEKSGFVNHEGHEVYHTHSVAIEASTEA